MATSHGKVMKFYLVWKSHGKQAFLKKVMENTPIPLDSREQLRRWVIDIHNLVNQDLGRLEVDYEEAPFSMYTIPPTISVSLFRICVVLCSAFLLHFVFQEAL